MINEVYIASLYRLSFIFFVVRFNYSEGDFLSLWIFYRVQL